MGGVQREQRVLNSWKEIAAYLDVNIRTAQKWEKERGLPVKRLPGERGRVWADIAAIEAWKNSDQPALQQERGLRLSRRPVSLRLVAALALAVVAAAALVIIRAANRRGQPALFRIEGKTLIVTDDQGRECWRKTFAKPLSLRNYSPNNIRNMEKEYAWFGDLTGDGRHETLFVHWPAEGGPEGSVFYCFSDDGKEKWHFVPGRRVASPREDFDRPFLLGRFAVVQMDKAERKAVLITSQHPQYYPNQVALLSPEGELVREYWHSGYLTELGIEDHDGDGRSEIYLGGVSNGAKSGTLVVLDPAGFEGASVEENPDYQLQGFAPGREVARILFPRSCLNRKFGPYARVSQLWMSDESITVHVAEQSAPYHHTIYELSRDCRLRRFVFADGFISYHAQLAAAGQLDHELSEEETEAMRQVRVLTAESGVWRTAQRIE